MNLPNPSTASRRRQGILRCLVGLGAFLLAYPSLLAREPEIGQKQRLANGHVEYVRGAAPLILAAPHGGRLDSTLYPVRGPGDGVRVSDSNTDRLLRKIAAALRNDIQVHQVVCDLKRKYVDVNRPLGAACDPSSAAVEVWRAYQDSIEVAKEFVTTEHGRGLFVELHGHGHSIPRLELGYLLRSRDFLLDRPALNAAVERASVREIVSRGNVGLFDLILGSESLGHFLTEEGVPSVPSPANPTIGDAAYFNGGWNTLQHGSRDSGTISAIQIECYLEGFRDTDEALDKSAAKLAKALLGFMNRHYALETK